MPCDISGLLSEFKGKSSKDRKTILTAKTLTELVAIGECLYSKSKRAKLKAEVGINLVLEAKKKIASILEKDFSPALLRELNSEVQWVKESLIACRAKNNILRDFSDAAAVLKKALVALNDPKCTALSKKITTLGLSRALRGSRGEGGTSRCRTQVADYIELDVEPKMREWSSKLDERSSDSEEENVTDTHELRDQIDELKDTLEIARADKVIVEERNTALENARALLGKQNRDLSQENQTLREENERLKETIRLFGHQGEFNPFGFDMDESSTATTQYHQFIAFRL